MMLGNPKGNEPIANSDLERGYESFREQNAVYLLMREKFFSK